MPSVPMKFRDTKGNRFAYKAGYGDGYNNRPDHSDIRAEDVKEAYMSGFEIGRKDHKKRWPELYAED